MQDASGKGVRAGGQIETMTQEVLVDSRCLQDERFRDRGIGQHVSTLLAGAHRCTPAGRRLRLIAGVDRSLPPLRDHHRRLFAAEQRLTAPPSAGTLFIGLSPMTHALDLLQPILTSPVVRSVAIVYDFIPLRFPGLYLKSPDARVTYLQMLAGLGDYDRFVSISQSTSDQLQQLLDIEADRCSVSGVAVRESVIGSGSASTSAPYCLTVLGGDPRKNVEAVVIAHGRSAALRAHGVGLKIVGHYSPDAQSRLRLLHDRAGGACATMVFIEGLDNADLANLYAQSLVTICPSRAEGFSLPVVEANANGCPVIVSACDAQIELMPLTAYQFEPDDHDRIGRLMTSFLDPAFGRKAMQDQGQFWRRYETSVVQDRFWDTVLGTDVGDLGGPARASFVSRSAKPKLAVASPVPPDQSGVADYTLATMTALARHATLDLYTETQGRVANSPFAAVRPLSSEPFVRGRHDATLAVIGNSHYHLGIFDLLLNYGGACVAHDARLLHFYAGLLGRERTLDVASREVGRPVDWSTVEGWLSNQRSLPTTFLSEVLEAASPTFVHSMVTQQFIKRHHAVETHYLPFAVYRQIGPEFAGPGGRERARQLLGFGADEKVIISLGDIIDDKAIIECIWAAAMLVSWGMSIRLVLAGRSEPAFTTYLTHLIGSLGMSDRVQISAGHVDERTYQALLIGADAAIQFRTYGLGGLSGALLDEIAVGLPTVANASLAEAMQAPSYVLAVPDGISPVLAAEQLATIMESPGRVRNEEERRAFCATHSVENYASLMLRGLGLAD